MAKCLIIGYGNSLRSDDGSGVKVAEIVANWQLPEVKSLSRHQLTPELAAELAQVDLVIFVDACQDGEEECIKLSGLNPADSGKLTTHTSDPTAILSLTQFVYGKCPQAWWLIVPGVNFQLGESLSTVAQRGINQALRQIRNLIKDFSGK